MAELFHPSDEILWKDLYGVDVLREQYGDGPFIVVEVISVPTVAKRTAEHSQWLRIAKIEDCQELWPNRLTSSWERAHDRAFYRDVENPPYFSGKWFRKA